MAKASELLAVATEQLGVKESPAGSNRVKYNTWYYGKEVSGSAYPWCMAFVQWVCAQAGVALPVRTASCGSLMRAAKTAGIWVAGDFKPGDIAIFDFAGGAATDHCGIIESVQPGSVTTIEGNTGSTSDADGGQVQRRDRAMQYVVGAVRPQYENEQEDSMKEGKRYNTVKECPNWAQTTIRKLVNKGYLSGDGKNLDLSHDMVRMLVINDRAGMYGA